VSGLPINGALVPVPGLTIVPPAFHGGPEWCQLSQEDWRARPAARVGIITPHTTGGRWPQVVLPGSGRGGHAREIFDMWRGRDRGPGAKQSSSSHMVVDFDGVLYCATDLQLHETFNAQAINPRNISIEMCTTVTGAIYQATLDTTVSVIAALTLSGRPGSGLFPIPFQHRAGPYNGQPLHRLEVGGVQSDGRDVVGIIGHRDQTGRRGRGDPGDELMLELQLAGSEPVDYDHGQDLSLGRQRQARLNQLTALRHDLCAVPLLVDGVCGPASLAAMRRHGFSRWRDVA